MSVDLPLPFHRYEALRRYIGYTSVDQRRMQQIAQLLEPYLSVFVHDFYQQILLHESAAKVITGGQAQVDRLKSSLAVWLREFLQGNFDAEYVERRQKVGKKHVVIGLDQIYASASLSRLRSHLTRALAIEYQGDKESLNDLLRTLNRRFDLDMVIIEDAYQQELMVRAAPISDARMRQQTAIARLGERALGSGNVAELLDHATATLGEMLHAPHVGLWQWQPRESEGGPLGHLVLRSGLGWPPDAIGTLRVPFSPKELISAAIRAANVLVVADFRSEQRFQTSPGLPIPDALSGLAVRIAGPRGPFGVLCILAPILRDFTEQDQSFLASVSQILAMALRRLDAESSLRDREERLQKMVEHLPAGAAYIRNNSMYINQAMEKITGYSRAELTSPLRWSELAQGPLPAQVRNALGKRTQAPHVNTFAIRRKDGVARMLEFSAYHEENEDIWLVHDVTEFREAEERFLRSERLAAIGQMIAGLAHESRNALQRIQSCTEMLEFEMEDRQGAMELLKRSQQAQQELHRLFDEVRDYSRPMKLDMSEVDLPQIWKEAWELLQKQREGRKANLIEQVQPHALVVKGDHYRLVQLFRNLFENALAACQDPCVIELVLTPAQIEGREALKCAVTDNGPGLTPEVQRRMFEPFFTTKTKGTGLGMAIAERLADAHGGKISAANGPNGGAQFCLLLPAESL